MKIITYQKNISKAAQLVERVVSKNPSLPILNNILIKTEDGRLKLSATNLEIGINSYIGSKVEEVGEIAVPARIFSDFVNNVSEEKITLTSKNNILYINTDKYKTQILGVDPKEFPIIPKIKNESAVKINTKVLKNSLISILDSVATSETRPELAGAFIQFNANKITLAATDSFRLTEKTIDFKNKENFTCILPRNTVTELIRVLGDMNEEISLKFGDNQISFYTDEMEIVSRLIDGNYPDYKKVIPEKYISKTLVKKTELEKNVRLAGLFSSNVADIKIICDDKSLNILAKNSDKGEIQVSLESSLKNEPFEISLNHNYLLDGLKTISTDNVVIEYTGQGSPLVLRPHYENKDLVYLIMPLRK